MTEGFYTHFWESGLIDDNTEQKCLEQSNCKIMRETKSCIFVYDDYNLQKFWVNKSNCLKYANDYLQEIYLHDTLKRHITKKDMKNYFFVNDGFVQKESYFDYA